MRPGQPDKSRYRQARRPHVPDWCNNGEFVLYDENTNRRYFYDFKYKNKIIEFNGDFWHANPKFFKSDSLLRYPHSYRVAKFLWEKDEYKILLANNEEFEVLTIWEYDYNLNKENIINECITFLKN